MGAWELAVIKLARREVAAEILLLVHWNVYIETLRSVLTFMLITLRIIDFQ